MLKTRNHAKTLILFVSERSKRDDALNHLYKTTHALTALYNVKIANERNLYSIYMSEPFRKVLFLFFDKAGLQNKQFCECIKTSIVAKITVVGIVREKMTTTRVLSFFSSLNESRRLCLESILDKAIQICPDNIPSAKMLMERIPSEHACNKVQLYTNKTLVSSTPNMMSVATKELEGCLLQKKLVLEQPVKARHKPTAFSYNLLANSNTSCQFPSPCKHNVRTASEAAATPKSLSAKKSEKTKTHVLVRSFSTDGTSSNSKKTPPPANLSTRPNDTAWKTNCPSIEITNNKDENSTPITATSTHLPWLSGEDRKIHLSTFLNDDDDNNTSAENKKMNRRKHSFDYIPKKYLVYDPGQSKNMLCVNFPIGMSQLRRESVVPLTPTISSARRTSIMLSSMNAGSSFDDVTLDSAPELNLFESPIPSPSQIRKRPVYPNPLPLYPDEICFPPLECFPCESLQQRRPSVFDVLLLH